MASLAPSMTSISPSTPQAVAAKDKDEAEEEDGGEEYDNGDEGDQENKGVEAGAWLSSACCRDCRACCIYFRYAVEFSCLGRHTRKKFVRFVHVTSQTYFTNTNDSNNVLCA